MSLSELENSSIKDLILELKDLFISNFLRLLATSAFALSLGIIWSLFLTPEFMISAKIGPNINSDQPVMSSTSTSLITSFLGAGSSSTEDMDNFKTAMYSLPVAKKLWDKGYDEIIYKNNFNQDSKTFVRSKPSVGERLGALILGYEINLEIGAKDLKSIIQSKVNFISPDFDPNVTLTIITSKPHIYKDLLSTLIRTTDDFLKEEKLSYANQQIDFLTNQALMAKDVDIKKALISSMKSKYLDAALLSNDLPYSHRIIDEPLVSEKPMSPNLPFICIFFTFIGFSFHFMIIFLRGKDIL
mgnify:CR=1 FL=1